MQKKRVLVAVSAVFYLALALLAVFAKKVHTAALPRVRIGYLEQKSVTIDGKQQYLPVLPEELYRTDIYRISEEEKNGEIRYVAWRIEVTVSDEPQGGDFAVLSGPDSYTPLIVEGFEALEEGREVLVENEEEIKSWD